MRRSPARASRDQPTHRDQPEMVHARVNAGADIVVTRAACPRRAPSAELATACGCGAASVTRWRSRTPPSCAGGWRSGSPSSAPAGFSPATRWSSRRGNRACARLPGERGSGARRGGSRGPGSAASAPPDPLARQGRGRHRPRPRLSTRPAGSRDLLPRRAVAAATRARPRAGHARDAAAAGRRPAATLILLFDVGSVPSPPSRTRAHGGPSPSRPRRHGGRPRAPPGAPVRPRGHSVIQVARAPMTMRRRGTRGVAPRAH